MGFNSGFKGLTWHVKYGVESAVVMSGWDETLPYFLMLWTTCHFNIINNEFAGQHSRKLSLDVLLRLTWRRKRRTLQRPQDKTNCMWWGHASLSLWQVQRNWNLGNNWLQLSLIPFSFRKWAKIIDWDFKKKKKSSVPIYQAKGPIRPDFPGTVPVLWLSNSSVPVSLKIRFGAPNGPEFFVVTQNITFLTTRTTLLPFPLWQKTYVRQPSNQRLTVINKRRRGRCVRYWL